jgi:hypothetical protein
VRLAELLLIAGVAVASSQAHASYRKCASDTITAPDAQALHHAARRAAGASKLVDSSLWVCMNPNRAFASYDGEREPQPDGSFLQPWVDCVRGGAHWTCQLNKNRMSSVDVIRDGKAVPFEFGMFGDLDVDLARKLVARAIETAPTLEVRHMCDATPEDLNNPATRDALRELQQEFLQAAPNGRAWVEKKPDGRYSVSLIGPWLRMRRADVGDEWIVECWAFDIVVT